VLVLVLGTATARADDFDSRATMAGRVELSLGARYELATRSSANEKQRGVGKLEAISCSECGYTEYYVADPKDIEPDGKNITWLT
jgi:hypothetical protein